MLEKLHRLKQITVNVKKPVWSKMSTCRAMQLKLFSGPQQLRPSVGWRRVWGRGLANNGWGNTASWRTSIIFYFKIYLF